MNSETKDFTIACLTVGIFLVILFGGLAWSAPYYNVFRAKLKGEAALREAESSKKVAIEEAKAKKESAALLADAEIERAKGVAQANKIIGDSLQGNDAYLRYLWIEGLKDSSGERVYIPTEAGLPILEARPSIN